ncbi:MAG: hypothetical protein ABIL16_00935 [candidate division WOR-3 bacterium]
MRLFVMFILFAAILGCKNEEEQHPPQQSGRPTSIDLYHGTVSLGPRSYFWIKFEAQDGDTLYFEARVKTGDGDISYAFWADSVNYAKWDNGESAQLNGYVEAVPDVSYSPVLAKGVYYVVVGNSALISSKTYWVRSYLRGLR